VMAELEVQCGVEIKPPVSACLPAVKVAELEEQYSVHLQPLSEEGSWCLSELSFTPHKGHAFRVCHCRWINKPRTVRIASDRQSLLPLSGEGSVNAG